MYKGKEVGISNTEKLIVKGAECKGCGKHLGGYLFWIVSEITGIYPRKMIRGNFL